MSDNVRLGHIDSAEILAAIDELEAKFRVPAQASLGGRPPDTSIQNNSGLPHGPAAPVRGCVVD